MQPTFTLAYSLARQPQDIIVDLIEQLGRPVQASLAFAYSTDANAPHLKAIIEALRRHTGIAHWVGSVGLGICCSEHEFYEQPAIAVMVTDFREDQFQVFTDPQDLLTSTPQEGLRFTVVHGEPRNGQLPQLIEQLPQQMGNGYLVGGLTSASQ
ncbi:MAG: FIST N-terminal domain-containing protein, partial [Gammaproteobacteria bacterium]